MDKISPFPLLLVWASRTDILASLVFALFCYNRQQLKSIDKHVVPRTQLLRPGKAKPFPTGCLCIGMGHSTRVFIRHG